MPDQLALYGSTLVRLRFCCVTEVACILLREGIIGPEIPFDLTKIVYLWRFKTRAISLTGTFVCYQVSILRRSDSDSCEYTAPMP